MNNNSNNIKTKIFSLVAIICLIATSFSIAPTPVDAAPSKYVKSLTLAKSKVSVNKGKSVKVKATVKVKGKPSKAVSVKSSNTKVASVKVSKPNSKGVSTVTVTGKKKGSATITVKTKAKNKKNKIITKKFKVTVKSGIGSDDEDKLVKKKDADQIFENARIVTSPVRLTFKSANGDSGFIAPSYSYFTVTSSNTSVVRIEARNGSYYAVPVSKGSATVTVAINSDAFIGEFPDGHGGWAKYNGVEGATTRSIDVTASDWVSGDDAKGRPAINDSLNSDDIRIWQENSVFSYDDIAHYVEADNFLMAKNGITEYGYGKLRTIVPYNQLSDGAKKTLARLGDKTYVTKLEPMQDGYQDYWVSSVDMVTELSTEPNKTRSTGYLCYNGEKDTPYEHYIGRDGEMIGDENRYLSAWGPEAFVPPAAARLMDKQGLVGMIRDADGTRHWYKSYNGPNIWGPKAEGAFGGTMPKYLRWPGSDVIDGYLDVVNMDVSSYFDDEFYTDKPSDVIVKPELIDPFYIYGTKTYGCIIYQY